MFSEPISRTTSTISQGKLSLSFRSDQAHPIEDKAASKTQDLVLKHLFLLLGYNSAEKFFHMSPFTIRYVN